MVVRFFLFYMELKNCTQKDFSQRRRKQKTNRGDEIYAWAFTVRVSLGCNTNRADEIKFISSGVPYY